MIMNSALGSMTKKAIRTTIEAYDNNDTDYWWTVSSSFGDLSKTINGTICIINKTLYMVDNGEVIYDFMYDE